MEALDLQAISSDLEHSSHGASSSNLARGRSIVRNTSLALTLEPREASPIIAQTDDLSPSNRNSNRQQQILEGIPPPASGVLSPTGSTLGASGHYSLGTASPSGRTPSPLPGSLLHKRSSSRDSKNSCQRLSDAFHPSLRETSSALKELYSKYEVYDSEEVGHGAYGVVIKGKQKATGEYVAIKRISKKRVSSRALSELQGEVETLTLVGNQWTIQLEDVIQDEEHLLIVMDYVPGGNLSDALKKVGRFSELTVRRYASCLLKAIEYVHSRGIAHRDLKPANCLLAESIFKPLPQAIQAPSTANLENGDLPLDSTTSGLNNSLATISLQGTGTFGELISLQGTGTYGELPTGDVTKTPLSSSGETSPQQIFSPPSLHSQPGHSPADLEAAAQSLVDIKIADFGFATMVGNGQCLTNFCGTTSYMAPEIISRNTNYGKECDMWSIGVMLYVLLCGELPFQGNSGDSLAAAVCSGDFSFEGPEWADVSNSAKSLLSKMLVVNPSKRITAREALKHPWVRSEVADGAREIDYPLGLPRSLSTHFKDKTRPMRPRIKGLVHLAIAAHRLVWYVKVKKLKAEGLDRIPVCRSFSFLVSHTFEPTTHSLVAGPLVAANPKAIRYLADMVDVSTTLETFDVSRTQIDNVDLVQHLVKVTVSHPSLTTLNLEDNPIPPLAGRTLLRLARKATGLTAIKCKGTTLGHDVIEQINSDLKDNERKRHMDVAAPIHQFGSGPVSPSGSSFGSYGSPIGSPSLLPVTSTNFRQPAQINLAAGGDNRRLRDGGGNGRGGGTYMLPPAFHMPFDSPVRALVNPNSTTRPGNPSASPGISGNTGSNTQSPYSTTGQTTSGSSQRSRQRENATRTLARNLGTSLVPSGNSRVLAQRAHSTSPHAQTPVGQRSGLSQSQRGVPPTSSTPTPSVGAGGRTNNTRSNLPPLHGSPGPGRTRF